MNGTHPTPELLDRFRTRTASPRELIEVDAHLAACDACFAAVREEASAVALPAEHLTYDELASFVDGSADDVEREAVLEHVSSCALCRDELSDLERVRDAMQPAPVRDAMQPPPVRGRRRRFTWVTAAALLVLVLTGAWLFSRNRQAAPVARTDTVAPAIATSTAPVPPVQTVVLERPAILDTLRGTGGVLRGGEAEPPFALRAPVATVVLDERPSFRWDAVPEATAYEVAIVDAANGEVVASGGSPSANWRPGAALPRGRTYSWQVTARHRDGEVVSPGPTAREALFRVASREEAAAVAAESEPLRRGIALAQRGMLDDAERELERAGAGELLARVRGWR